MKARISIAMLALLLLTVGGCDDDDSVIGTDDGLPVVRMTSPVENEHVADLILLSAEASDNKGITKVDFYVDAQQLNSDAAAPYEVYFNSRALEGSMASLDGRHSAYAVAWDSDENRVGSQVVTFVVDTTLRAPSPVTLLAPANVSDSSVSLTWSRNSDVDFRAYQVRYDTAALAYPSLSETEVMGRDDTTLLITDLRDNARYRFAVTVEDLFHEQTPSNVVEASTSNAAPPQPTILSALRIPTGVRISWVQVSIWDFDRYEIYRSDDALFDAGDLKVGEITEIDVTAYDYDTSDTLAGNYFVLLVDSTGLSTVSDFRFVSEGRTNHALSFDGGDFATIPYFEALNLGTQYTLEAWVSVAQPNTFARVIDRGPLSGDPYLTYSLICSPRLGTDMCSDGGYSRLESGPAGEVPYNEWHHIALTHNNGTVIYFIDGLPVDTSVVAASAACDVASPMSIGRRRMFNEFYFHGIIDEVRVWNVVRSPSVILTNHAVHLTGSESGLVCYFDFDEGSGNEILSPVGGDGFLGLTSAVESSDPAWVLSTAPIQY